MYCLFLEFAKLAASQILCKGQGGYGEKGEMLHHDKETHDFGHRNIN